MQQWFNIISSRCAHILPPSLFKVRPIVYITRQTRLRVRKMATEKPTALQLMAIIMPLLPNQTSSHKREMGEMDGVGGRKWFQFDYTYTMRGSQMKKRGRRQAPVGGVTRPTCDVRYILTAATYLSHTWPGSSEMVADQWIDTHTHTSYTGLYLYVANAV